jgi:hypothetical protein
VDNCIAKATIQGFSPFGVVVPIDDASPPRTALSFIGAEEYVMVMRGHVPRGHKWFVSPGYVYPPLYKVII